MLRARVIKARREFTVDVTLSVGSGERLAIFGASGAGKSTVLSCIAGFETPDSGEIRCGDQLLFAPPMPLWRRHLGYLTQNDWLFPHLSVEQNVCFGLADSRNGAAAPWIAELKERLMLTSLWRARAQNISGGQARRVALARMLARRPPLVLLDEPFSALDRALTNDLLDALDEWQTQLKFILVAVDHRADILARICPTVVALEDGRAVQMGSWDELAAAPATPLLARLLQG